MKQKAAPNLEECQVNDKPNWPIWAGVGASAVIVALGVWAGLQKLCETAGGCQSKFSALIRAPFNEVGDTLAGFASALAFVWIIVTVALQSKELAAQREELKATREELILARIAQQAQLETMQAQTAIFQVEQKVRTENKARLVLDQLFEKLRLHFIQNSDFSIVLTIRYASGGGTHSQRSIEIGRDKGADVGGMLTKSCSELSYLERSVEEGKRQGWSVASLKYNPNAYGPLEPILAEILCLLPELSEADALKVRNYKVGVISRQLSKLLDYEEETA